MNIWPPFVGAGIKVVRIADDFHEIRVALRQKWFNKNIVGSHFGGSLYAMVDPFYMIMLMNILGKDYIVWDKFASIDFIAPGKGTVTATFSLDTRHRLKPLSVKPLCATNILLSCPWILEMKMMRSWQRQRNISMCG